MKLIWVTLNVSDLNKSLDFYSGLLKLEVAEKLGNEEHQIVMLGKQNEPKVELIFEPNRTTEKTGKGISFGLQTDNLNQMIQELEKHGYKASEPISPEPDIRFSFVKDPDGYIVQLVEQK